MQTPIKMNLTLQQLKNIIELAEKNQETHYFADNIITFQVSPNFVKVTQPVREEFEEFKDILVFDKLL